MHEPLCSISRYKKTQTTSIATINIPNFPSNFFITLPPIDNIFEPEVHKRYYDSMDPMNCD